MVCWFYLVNKKYSYAMPSHMCWERSDGIQRKKWPFSLFLSDWIARTVWQKYKNDENYGQHLNQRLEESTVLFPKRNKPTLLAKNQTNWLLAWHVQQNFVSKLRQGNRKSALPFPILPMQYGLKMEKQYNEYFSTVTFETITESILF